MITQTSEWQGWLEEIYESQNLHILARGRAPKHCSVSPEGYAAIMKELATRREYAGGLTGFSREILHVSHVFGDLEIEMSEAEELFMLW